MTPYRAVLPETRRGGPRRAGRIAALVGGIFCLLPLGCDSVGVKRAYTALDSDGKRKRDFFYTDTEAIFCIVELANGREGLTVQARWLSNYFEAFDLEGQRHEERRLLGMDEVVPGTGDDVRVGLELKRESAADPYPAGSFECEFYFDGELAVALPVEIRIPECPEAPLETGYRCAGFVRSGSECPGALSGSTCVCGPEGQWSCE